LNDLAITQNKHFKTGVKMRKIGYYTK